MNEDATGFALTNANLALSILNPTNGSKTKYIALSATASQVGFVGMDVFQMEAANIAVKLNLATSGGADKKTPVVDFTSGVFASELLALFDSNNDGSVTVGELRVLNGQAATGAIAYTDLYASDADETDVISLDQIVSALDVDDDGSLSLSEAQNFLSDDSLATIADADNDNIIDPVGMEVATGTSSSFYLNESRRRIFAAADNVYINVSDFLYLKGSVAFDLGTREVVTVSTGIPSALGNLIPQSVLDSVNSALSGLTTTLNTLETQIYNALDTALDTLISTLEGLVDNVVTQIVSAVSTASNILETAKNNVATTVENALRSVIDSAISSISTKLNTFISTNITDQISNDTLKSIVGELVDPVIDLVSSAASEMLQDAFASTIDRISNSVSSAIEAGANKIEEALRDAVTNVIQPQIDRVRFEIENRVIARIQSTLTPIFNKLRGLTQISFSGGTDDERMVLFDTNSDGSVTVGELRALSGQSAYSSGGNELYAVGANDSDVIDINTLVAILDDGTDGILSVTEAKTFLSSGNAALADTADANNDNYIIYPGGYNTIENVEVDVTALGINNATAFVGLPPLVDERLALFDTDKDGVITVGELRVLNGQATDTAIGYTSSVGELYASTANSSDKVDADTLVSILRCG